MKDNTDYWKKFYNTKQKDLMKPSLFAEFVLTKIKKDCSLIDIACGNGKDTKFFENNGINVLSLDYSDVPFFLGQNFIKADALNFNYKADVYYARFFLHAINEKQLNKFLFDRSKNMEKDSLFFIETRSTTGISTKNKEETFYNSGIGDSHYRMLYSLDYLSSLLATHFKIDYIEESNEFAPFLNHKPFIIRAILKKKCGI
ncbi:class I SAM-dependent methyltransferase [bacterium]|nr:class I SAM-dependent methyltransferase [bacterium]